MTFARETAETSDDCQAALANLSLIGSILIFCVGVNLVFGKRIESWRICSFRDW